MLSFILQFFRDADEKGDKTKAIELYTQAVEIIISIDDKEKREKLNKFAIQALNRAEELKGIKNDDKKKPEPIASRTVPVQSPNSSVSNSSKIVSHIPPSSQPKLEVVGKQIGYTLDEKKVLEFTSHINKKTFLPFMDIDLKERFSFPIPFTDRDGLLELSPKQKRDFDCWVRISELCENPVIISGKYPDFYSIRQTVVSDCSFVASLAVSALYEKKFNKRILTSIIYPRNSKVLTYNLHDYCHIPNIYIFRMNLFITQVENIVFGCTLMEFLEKL